MKCTEEVSGYCKTKVSINKFANGKICDECCIYCLYKKECDSVCPAVREQYRNNVKVQITFDFNCGECGSCEVDEALTIFEYEVENYLKSCFEDVRNVKVRELEE